MNSQRTKQLRDDFIAEWINTHSHDTEDYKLKKAWRQYKKHFISDKRRGLANEKAS